MIKVLLLGGGLQGLSCGESLYKKYLVDIVSNGYQISKSKFFHKVYSGKDVDTCDFLLSIICKEKYDVVIPMGDKNVQILSKLKNQIESAYNCHCACPFLETLEIVEDKHHFMQFCKENGIPHPRTASLSRKSLFYCSKEIGYPSLIKPDHSVGARGITRVNSLDELKSSFPIIEKKYGTCTLQEYVENKEYYYNVMIYRNVDGGILAHAIIKILRMYPVDAGSSTCCVTIEDNTLLTICKDCLEKLNWVGMADFDVLQNPKNGEYKVIEINPRVPASLRAASISGVNFPEIIVQNCMSKDIPTFQYNTGKVLRYLGTDLMWFCKSANRFNTTPNWFKFVGDNIYYQDIYYVDPSTWWSWIIIGIQKIFRRNKRMR